MNECEGNLKNERIESDKIELKTIAKEIGAALCDTDIISVNRHGKKDVIQKVHGEEVIFPRDLVATLSGTAKPI